MGKVAKFEVVLNNPTGIYHPGDTLTGQVELKVQEDIHIHGQYLLYHLSAYMYKCRGQMAVSAHFTSKHILPFGFAGHYCT